MKLLLLLLAVMSSVAGKISADGALVINTHNDALRVGAAGRIHETPTAVASGKKSLLLPGNQQ